MHSKTYQYIYVKLAETRKTLLNKSHSKGQFRTYAAQPDQITPDT